MPALNTVLADIQDETVKDELMERLELVAHKIKFMETMPVAVLDSMGNANAQLSDYLLRTGARFTADLHEAVYIVFYEADKNLEDLMRSAPVHLQPEWPAVSFGRVCLLADSYLLNSAEENVALVEDLAEMLHPGHFIFGSEGNKWIRFGV